MGNIVYYPAQEQNIIYLKNQMFATLVCMIPPGKVSSVTAICDMWAKRHGKQRCLLANDGILPLTKSLFFRPENVARVDFITDLATRQEGNTDDWIPYHRLISSRGYLIDFGQYASKETSAIKLAQEGHTILEGRPEVRSYKLKDYKDALFDWDRVIIKD